MGELFVGAKRSKLHLDTGERIAADEPLLGRSVMAMSEGYGQRLAECLRAEHAPAVVAIARG